MKKPIFVRDLTEEEEARLKQGLRSKDGFEVRRSQIILASARKQTAIQIGRELNCDDQTVRNVIKQFNARGLEVLKAKSNRPHTIKATFSEDKIEPLKELLHQSPRNFGKETSIWTLELLAEVSYEAGLTEEQVSRETVRQALKRFGIAWKRAKQWINSPDPAYLLKKKQRERLMAMAAERADWAVGYQDETWWSRSAHPPLRRWAEKGQCLKLHEQAEDANDPEPKAMACYGIAMHWYEQTVKQEAVWLRFVEGNPRSELTVQYLEWLLTKTHQAGKRVLILFWDQASWHKSRAVQDWITKHNRKVKQEQQGVRLLAFLLPKKSPWLNPIEPLWLHAKRKIVEPGRKLAKAEIIQRVCAVFDNPVLSVFTTSENVS
jgi:transposase